MSEKTFVSLATEAYRAMETRTRNDGSEFICFRDGSPQWMSDLATTVHGSMFADDQRYRLLEKVLCGIAELDDETDPDEVFDLLYDDCSTFEGDVYNSDLLKWVGSAMGTRPGYVDEVVEEYGYTDFYNVLMRAQSCELQEIAYLVIAFIEDMLD